MINRSESQLIAREHRNQELKSGKRPGKRKTPNQPAGRRKADDKPSEVKRA